MYEREIVINRIFSSIFDSKVSIFFQLVSIFLSVQFH